MGSCYDLCDEFVRAVEGTLSGILLGDVGVEQILEMLPRDPCPDQAMGKVKTIRQRIGDVCNVPFERKNDVPGDSALVVVILESPNKDEYRLRNGKWISIGPACGCTGCLLLRHWHEVFGTRFDEYELVIMNVVQYQCSLASAGQYKRYKDEIVHRCLACTLIADDLPLHHNAKTRKPENTGQV